MALELVGAVTSTLAWLAATHTVLRIQAAEIRRVPPVTRNHPLLAGWYEGLLAVRIRDQAARHGAAWSASFLLVFGALTALDFSLPFLLLLSAVLAGGWAVLELEQNWKQGDRLVKRATGQGVRRGRWLKVRCAIALSIEWFAFLAALLFLARAVVGLVIS